MTYIIEPEKKVPVIDNVDICVLGGGCTGVFAAVRAARLGAKVVIVEKQNNFGGVATSGLVNVWHSLNDTTDEKQIIAGLTSEVIERLKKRKAVSIEPKSHSTTFRLNTEELKIELDELIQEENVKPYLHSFYVDPYINDGKLKGVFLENKSGRGVIKADIFIDATGDGDLCYDMEIPYRVPKSPQAPSTCAKILGLDNLSDFNLSEALKKYGDEFNLDDDWGWGTYVPDAPEVSMQALTHVFEVNCAEADQLTYSEIEGRRQIRAIMDIIRKYGPNSDIALLALSSYIGIRETRHFSCEHQLTEEDVLYGNRFDDAIANGTYRVDIHHSDPAGVTFKYLDGTQEFVQRGKKNEVSRWREKIDNPPTFYQIPYRSMITDKINNLIMCGRMIDADEGAFGAIRVMVNLNQTGEAAGVAAYIALDKEKSVNEIAYDRLRNILEDGGSIII